MERFIQKVKRIFGKADLDKIAAKYMEQAGFVPSSSKSRPITKAEIERRLESYARRALR